MVELYESSANFRGAFYLPGNLAIIYEVYMY